jgi:hypothetical protein
MMEYELNPEEVRAQLDQHLPFTLLDVREPWEFATAKIEGAMLMPMNDVPSPGAPGTRPRGPHRCSLPPRGALTHRHQLAAAARIREGPIHARRNRRMVSGSGSQYPALLKAVVHQQADDERPTTESQRPN